MYLIKPMRPGAINALTGQPLPTDGVQRGVLLPPDHYAERTGDISITDLTEKAAAPPETLPKPPPDTPLTKQKPEPA